MQTLIPHIRTFASGVHVGQQAIASSELLHAASQSDAELARIRDENARLRAALEMTVVTIGNLIGGSTDYARCDQVRDAARAALQEPPQ